MVKGIIFDFKRYAIHDGPGIRLTVFLQGCPLQCWWCHNPEGRKPKPDTIPNAQDQTNVMVMTVDEVMDEIEKDILFYDESGGGVTFSGGEPLMQHEFLNSILHLCKTKDIHTALDTSGYAAPEILHSISDKQVSAGLPYSIPIRLCRRALSSVLTGKQAVIMEVCDDIGIRIARTKY